MSDVASLRGAGHRNHYLIEKDRLCDCLLGKGEPRAFCCLTPLPYPMGGVPKRREQINLIRG
jgi:hypothetical protein